MRQKYYHWLGINQSGKKDKGIISANNRTQAIQILQQKNITLIKISRRVDLKSLIAKNITQKNVAEFTRQLSTLVNSGIPILSTLNIIDKSSNDPALKNLIKSIKQDLESGHTLSFAFKNHPQQFDSLFCNLIYAGEQSGTLDLMLMQLSNYKEKIITLKRKAKKALFYPLIILSVAGGVSAILLIFVIPQFAELFNNFGAPLPPFTLLIIRLAKILHDYWYLLILIPACLTIAMNLAIKRSKKCAFMKDALLLRLPFVGQIMQKSIIARLTRSFAITCKAGIPLNEILNILTKLAENRVYSQELAKAQNLVISGQTLAFCLNNQQLFPARIQQMIAIGEESGTLDSMLIKTAEYYETEVDQHLDNLNNLLEPAIIVILGIIIGGLLTGMYLPIFKLGTVI